MFRPNEFPPPRPSHPSPAGHKARDLADFCLRWQEFRPRATSILTRATLDPAEEDCLNWLIALADRVGSDDVGTGPL
ncbi:MAG: hypothetical protein ACKVPY_04195 [Paracoccaceae bacterium]